MRKIEDVVISQFDQQLYEVAERVLLYGYKQSSTQHVCTNTQYVF